MTHPPPFDLDRLHAGECDEQAAAELQSHLDRCAECQKYLSEIGREQDRLLAARSPEEFLAGLRPPEHRPAPAGRWVIWGLAATAAAVMALLVVYLRAGQPEQGQQLRWMGDRTAVQVFVDRGGRTFELQAQALRAGDRLRFRLARPAGERAYVVLLAAEANRAFPVLPDRPEARPFEIEAEAFLPGSVVIEPGEKPVELLLVVRPEPFELEPVLNQLERELTSATATGPVLEGLVFRLRLPRIGP